MAKTYRTLDDLLIDCTARVQTQGGHGTGFFVAPGLILTCAHVILDAFQKNTPITVHYGGNVFPVEPISQKNVFSAPYPDLALLRVDIPDHPCVLLGTEYRAFTNFYSYGFTKDHPDGESTTVECEGTQEDAGTLIKLKEGQVKPGSSGSPLLNINNGTVCGLMKLTRDRSSDLGGAGIPMITVFASFPEIEGQNLAFHQHDSRWSSLLEKEQEIKGSNSVVALLYTEPGKIAQPRYFVGRAEILAQVNSLLD